MQVAGFFETTSHNVLPIDDIKLPGGSIRIMQQQRGTTSWSPKPGRFREEDGVDGSPIQEMSSMDSG